MTTIHILGIESSCDDTSAAVIRNGELLSNVISGQEVHRKYGGVVPELASRAHQQHIVPVVDQALSQANLSKDELHAVAFTQGPGLLGSLMVGSSFAKGVALARDLPLIAVNHLMAHVLALFLKVPGEEKNIPSFPYLSLLVSGGHTQIMVVEDFLRMKTLGRTMDDAAGEAFDKCAKVMGLPYPGGPVIDQLAREGDPDKFSFAMPHVKDLNFSFSGLKTSFLYFIRDAVKKNPDFIEEYKADLAASLQKVIVTILVEKIIKASEVTGIKEIGIAGGVAANSGLKKELRMRAAERKWHLHIPPVQYTTDNAAMIAITGYYQYLAGQWASQESIPRARMPL